MLFYIIIIIPTIKGYCKGTAFFRYMQILCQENLLMPPNCRQICPLRLSIRPAKGFIPKNLFVHSNAKYYVSLSINVICFPHIKDKSLDLQKLGLAKMKIKKCNFCKSINTLKINKINSKNVKMSKCQLISRACMCVYIRVCVRIRM